MGRRELHCNGGQRFRCGSSALMCGRVQNACADSAAGKCNSRVFAHTGACQSFRAEMPRLRCNTDGCMAIRPAASSLTPLSFSSSICLSPVRSTTSSRPQISTSQQHATLKSTGRYDCRVSFVKMRHQAAAVAANSHRLRKVCHRCCTAADCGRCQWTSAVLQNTNRSPITGLP